MYDKSPLTKKAGQTLRKIMPVVKIKVGTAKPKVAKMSRGMEKRMISELDSGTKMMRKKDTSKIGSKAMSFAKGMTVGVRAVKKMR